MPGGTARRGAFQGGYSNWVLDGGEQVCWRFAWRDHAQQRVVGAVTIVSVHCVRWRIRKSTIRNVFLVPAISSEAAAADAKENWRNRVGGRGKGLQLPRSMIAGGSLATVAQ